MAEEKEVSPELTKAINEATSSDEIREALAQQPRDEKGQFVSAKQEEKKVEEPAEPTVVKDTFLIGGKPVEFEADSTEHLLAQVKVAQQAYQMAQKPEEKKVEVPKPAFTPEELAALSLRMTQGDLSATEEFITKSGIVDKILEAKGIKPDEYKAVLKRDRDAQYMEKWDTAKAEFLQKSDWPGGDNNGKLMGYKLIELGLQDDPSAANFQKAYDALKTEGLLFERAATEEAKTETAKVEAKVEPKTAATTGTTTTPKRQATGSTAFGTSQEQGTRKSGAAPKVPEITADMTPEQIMEAWKKGIMAEGKSPNEALHATYAGRA